MRFVHYQRFWLRYLGSLQAEIDRGRRERERQAAARRRADQDRPPQLDPRA